ncbi:MAG TPA: alpha/beta hydrolase [Acidimicrobiales bacterium]|nr:alpha/beta hydrolase [Acidimicrobiales bacterium]
MALDERAPDDAESVSYPGARPPDRRRTVQSHGVAIAVHEWGDEADPPLLFTHGGFDFARTFSVFAPMVAAAGWRVVAWDQRGHGDSEHTSLYSWDADVRDALAVMDTISSRPVPVVAHSKGGNLMLHLADACPHRVSHVVNIDGLPSRRPQPDVADHERTRMRAGELSSWLDHRRGLASALRRPGTIDDLARRRARMNPRLPMDWLRYLVTVGARRDEDGWRWKIDPSLRMGGFGPWRPEWAMSRLSALGMPVLGILGVQPEVMGWNTDPADVAPFMPPGGRLVTVEEAGHFVHIEAPERVAALTLEFLG